MKRNFARPKWFILYLLTFLYLGAFWMQLKTGISEAGHIWVEASLTCVYFGLVLAWLQANEQAMWLEEQEKREVSRQSSAISTTNSPERGQRTVLANNGNSRLEQPFKRRISQVMPAWAVILVSHLGDLFKSLR